MRTVLGNKWGLTNEKKVVLEKTEPLLEDQTCTQKSFLRG